MAATPDFGSRAPRATSKGPTRGSPHQAPAGLVTAVEGLERRMIRDALSRAGGVQTRAAELLGISERVLRYKLCQYGLAGDR